MIVGYDATAAVRQSAGIGRYARELLIALNALPVEEQYRLPFAAHGASVALPPLGPNFRPCGIPITDRVANAMWQRLRLPVPIELRTGRLDVFHSPDFSLAPSRAPAILTVHDLAFEIMPQVCYPTLAAYLHRVVPRCVRRAEAVIVPSNHVKSDIVKQFGTDPAKVHVIPEGSSGSFGSEPSDLDGQIVKRYRLRTPFLLTVGTLEPRKNLERLLDAFARLRDRGSEVHLMIAGKPGWLYQGIFERHQALGLGKTVRFLRNVDDAALASLYRRAAAVVYPSLYEGFGLPVLEALASGAPVVCSGNTSMPEVAGNAALYVDPWDVEDIAQTIEDLLSDEQLQSRLRQAGPPRAADFTWGRTAQRTHELYVQVAHA